MFEKEAEEYAKFHHFSIWDEANEEYITDDDEVVQAYIAGAEAHQTKWHDLRKDPNDLPKKDCEVIILHENGRKHIQKWKNGNWTNAIVVPVIKWCEIPKE